MQKHINAHEWEKTAKKYNKNGIWKLKGVPQVGEVYDVMQGMTVPAY